MCRHGEGSHSKENQVKIPEPPSAAPFCKGGWLVEMRLLPAPLLGEKGGGEADAATQGTTADGSAHAEKRFLFFLTGTTASTGKALASAEAGQLAKRAAGPGRAIPALMGARQQGGRCPVKRRLCSRFEGARTYR